MKSTLKSKEMESVWCSIEMKKADNFANEIAEACYSKYVSLPKTGKPNEEREWTHLAGIVKVEGWQKDVSCSSYVSMDVVAIGTGSKCIGKSKMSPSGDILNDGHAEVMARRGLLRYLYDQILETYRTGSSEVFKCFSGGKCFIKDNVTFHFFASHTPCGDASIIPKVSLYEDEVGRCLKRSTEESLFDSKRAEGNLHENSVMVPTRNLCCDFSCANLQSEMMLQRAEGKKRNSNAGVASNKRKYHSEEDSFKSKLSSGRANICGGSNQRARVKYREELVKTNTEEVVISDIYRTGAKCLPLESLQDPHVPGTDYHVVGALRTKPGRGDPTQSLSCSDKLARWNVVGLQGALLSLLVNEPIYFKSLVIGGGCPFSKASLKRAVIGRLMCGNNGENNSSYDEIVQASAIGDGISLPSEYAVVNPLILRSALPFKHARTPGGKKQPCPSSIVWCKVPERAVEVAVEGKKQGVTKKVALTSAGRLLVCKRELLQQFVNVASSMPDPTFHLPSLLKLRDVTSDVTEIKQCLIQMPYKQLKNLSQDYKQAWNAVRAVCFPSWITKCDSLSSFSLAN